MPTRPSPRSPWLAATAVGLLLAACADRSVTGSTYPRDVPKRHPIVLTDAPRTLDLFFVASAGLDPRQAEDVRTFAEEYRRYGQGPLVAQLPADARGASSHRLLDEVRAILDSRGVPGGHMSVATYHPADPTTASPVRLSFQRLQAKVASKCGLWPQDLGASDAGFNTRNEPHWNLGCSTQSNMAAQIADPVDLVRGRTEGRIDSIRRSRDIENLRQGKDPSTHYRQDDKGRINTTVGN